MRIHTHLTAIAVTGILCSVLAHPQTSAAHMEHELFKLVNDARQAEGLPSLKWDDALANAARRHAEVMAQHGEAQHVFEGEASQSSRARQAGARFTWLSENVIQATSPAQAHAAFMKSPSHRANILDKDMDSTGVGVLVDGDQLFVVEDFSKAR